MTLRPPEKVEKLQTVLRAKAKASPGYRFYSLYDKVYRADVLAHAFDRCRANGGAPGVDGQTFANIESWHAAGRRGLAAVGESLHATVRAGLETGRTRAAAGSPHRERCRRLRDLLQAGAGRYGPSPDAVDDGAAEAHGERAEDAAGFAPGRDVHLPGIHVRGASLLEDGPAGISTCRT